MWLLLEQMNSKRHSTGSCRSMRAPGRCGDTAAKRASLLHHSLYSTARSAASSCRARRLFEDCLKQQVQHSCRELGGKEPCKWGCSRADMRTPFKQTHAHSSLKRWSFGEALHEHSVIGRQFGKHNLPATCTHVEVFAQRCSVRFRRGAWPTCQHPPLHVIQQLPQLHHPLPNHAGVRVRCCSEAPAEALACRQYVSFGVTQQRQCGGRGYVQLGPGCNEWYRLWCKSDEYRCAVDGCVSGEAS